MSFFDLDKPDLNSRYLPMKPEEAEELWQEIYDGCYEHCIHGQTCPSGSACVQGRRITMVRFPAYKMSTVHTVAAWQLTVL